MKIISVIPVLNNKSFENLNGFSILSYSIAISKLSDINECYIVTNFDKSIEFVKKYNVSLVKIFKENLSEKESLTKVATENKLNQDDLIVLLNPMIPNRQPKIIKNAIKYFKMYYETRDSLRSIQEIKTLPSKYVKINKNVLKPYIKKSNDNLEKIYIPNKYIDIIKVSSLSKSDFYGLTQFPYIINSNNEIKNEEDLEYCKWKMNNENNILLKYLKEMEK